MGAGVTQQSLHLGRSVGSAAQRNADSDLLHVRHYGSGRKGHADRTAGGNKWGNMPYRFQPIPT